MATTKPQKDIPEMPPPIPKAEQSRILAASRATLIKIAKAADKKTGISLTPGEVDDLTKLLHMAMDNTVRHLIAAEISE